MSDELQDYAYALLLIVYAQAVGWSVFATWYGHRAVRYADDAWRATVLLRARCMTLVSVLIVIVCLLVVALVLVNGLTPVQYAGGWALIGFRVVVFYVLAIILSALQTMLYLTISHSYGKGGDG